MDRPPRQRRAPFALLRIFPGRDSLADNPIYLRLSGRGCAPRRRRDRRSAVEFKRPQGEWPDLSMGRAPVALFAVLAFALRGTGWLVWSAVAFSYAMSIWGPWERKAMRFMANAAREKWGEALCVTGLPREDYGRALFSALWEREAFQLARLLGGLALVSIPYWVWAFGPGWDAVASGPWEGAREKALGCLGGAIVWGALWLELMQAAAINLTLRLYGQTKEEFGEGLEREVSHVAIGTLLFAGLKLPGALAIAAISLAEVSLGRPWPSASAELDGALALLAFAVVTWPGAALALGELQKAGAESFGKALEGRMRER